MKGCKERRLCTLSSVTTDAGSTIKDATIPLIERLWSYITRCRLWNASKSKTDDEHSFVVEIDAMDLIDSDVVLGEWAIHDPEETQYRLMTFLRELQLVTVTDRVWLRFKSVPMALTTVHRIVAEEQQERFRVHVCGIVIKAGIVRWQVYGQCYRCVYCGQSWWMIHIGKPDKNEPCCAEQILDPHTEEDKQSTVAMPTQCITLRILDCSCLYDETDSCFRRDCLSMEMYDDLAGKFRLGDVIDVFAMVQLTSKSNAKSKACYFGHPTDLNVHCIHAEVVDTPYVLTKADNGSLLHGEQEMSLESVCTLMQKAMPYIHPPSLLIASLLSAVMIGTETTINARNQIHILLSSHGRDPYAYSMLRRIAKILSPLNAIDDVSASCLAIFDQLQSKEEVATAGYLTRTRMGISVLDLELMSKKERKHCLDYLGVDTCHSAEQVEFTVPATSAIWATGNAFVSSRAGNNVPGIVQQLDDDLVDAFDLIVCYSVEHDPLYDQHVINRLLEGNEGNETDVLEFGRSQIRSVLAKATTFGMPKLSKEAKRLLELYFTYVRNPSDFGEDQQARRVPFHVFRTLICLSKASARLTFSPIVRCVPDVTLAIKLTEETLLEGGVFQHPSQLLLNLEGISHQFQYPSLDAELSAMHGAIKKILVDRALEIET